MYNFINEITYGAVNHILNYLNNFAFFFHVIFSIG